MLATDSSVSLKLLVPDIKEATESSGSGGQDVDPGVRYERGSFAVGKVGSGSDE